MANPGPKPQDWQPRLWRVVKWLREGMKLAPACALAGPENPSGLRREYYRQKAAGTLPTGPPVARVASMAVRGWRHAIDDHRAQYEAQLQAGRVRLLELGYDPDQPGIAAWAAEIRREMNSLQYDLPRGTWRVPEGEAETDENIGRLLEEKTERLDHLEDLDPALAQVVDALRKLGRLG